MLKKILIAGFVLMSLAFTLISCGGGCESGEHNFSEEYLSDADFHWKSCSGCEQISEKEAHTIDAEGICSVCKTLGVTEGVVYELSADKSYAKVVGYNGVPDRVRIAEKYEGKPVRELCDGSFFRCDIEYVHIPYCLEIIGDDAFYYCTELAYIYVEEGNESFKDVNGNLYTSDGKTLIKYTQGKADTEFAVPSEVENIGVFAFLDCSALESVSLGNNIKSIGDSAFKGCSGLTSLTIPESVLSIGDSILFGCSALFELNIDGEIVIDESLTSGCLNIKSLVIGNRVKSIEDGAFSYYGSLESVTVGAGVESIGKNAFVGCMGLTDIYYVGSEEEWKKIGVSENAFPESAVIRFNEDRKY